MLPSNLFDPPRRSEDHDRNDRNMNQASQPAAAPPLGVTGVMCQLGSLQIPHRGTIHYRIFRPRQLKPPPKQIRGIQYKPPLVVIHGGPMIPCNYLLPLAYIIVDRAVIFYDQLGCGQSTVVDQNVLFTTTTKPNDDDNDKSNSNDNNTDEQHQQRILDLQGMVDDLEALIEHWNFSSKDQCHILGHSFGGLIAYEYCKKIFNEQGPSNNKSPCLSLILASVPTSTQLVELEVQRLCQELKLESNNNTNNNHDQRRTRMDDDDYDDDEENVGGEDEVTTGTLPKHVPTAFRDQYECRIVPTPYPLVEAYQNAGPINLRGLNAIGNYAATAPIVTATAKENESQQQQQPMSFPPTLITRGQYDFVTEKCIEGWNDILLNKQRGSTSSSNNNNTTTIQQMVLGGCSHYGMLENENLFGSVVSSFLNDHD